MIRGTVVCEMYVSAIEHRRNDVLGCYTQFQGNKVSFGSSEQQVCVYKGEVVRLVVCHC